jgi:multidrug efflux pump subunit AcrB
MRIAHFFIDHPRFAAVINIFIVVFGLAAMVILPIAQYPNIVPPTIQVITTYPGASAETVARTVATPLEQAINGVEGMDYISSQSTGNGQLVITTIFKIGTDPNTCPARLREYDRRQVEAPSRGSPWQSLAVAPKSVLLASIDGSSVLGRRKDLLHA